MEPESDFRKTAEAFAKEYEQVPVDPNAKRRNELAQHLFGCVQQAAQARADLLKGSQGDAQFRAATNFRTKDGEAQQALAALIEFEAGLL